MMKIVIATKIRGNRSSAADSIAGRAYSNVCRRILGEEIRSRTLQKAMDSFIGSHSYSIRIKEAVRDMSTASVQIEKTD